MNCLICNKKEAVKFKDDYKLEIKEDKDYFKNAKIYRCNDCNFGFVYPIFIIIISTNGINIYLIDFNNPNCN